MASTVSLLFLGAFVISTASAVNKELTCEEFSRGTSFSFNQALGKWYLVHSRDHPRAAHCVQFSAISDKDRKDLQGKLGKHLKGLKWENLQLKMQFTCYGDVETSMMVYYLESQGAEGSYEVYQVFPAGENLEMVVQKRQMRLKVVEKKYLAMMDCTELYTFLLDKEVEPKEDPALINTLKNYLFEE